MKTTLHVEPIPFESGRFFVASSSRPGIKHLVDMCWQETPRSAPVAKCSCEQCMIRGGICKHIEATVNYLNEAQKENQASE